MKAFRFIGTDLLVDPVVLAAVMLAYWIAVAP